MVKQLGLVAIFSLTVFLVCIFPYGTIDFNLLQISTEKTANSGDRAAQIQLSLGTNLNGISDWSTEMPFLDAFKSARKWITQCLPEEPDCRRPWNTHESAQLDLDEYGWVRSLPAPEDAPEYTRVGTLMFRDVGSYPGGKYVVLYDGEGTIEYELDARKDESASISGRDIIEVNPSNKGIYLIITATDPHRTGNYIRNLHLVPEKYEKNYETEIFNPKFFTKVSKFKTLRFMDWMSTNNSQQSEWQNRPKPESYSYSFRERGVPLEIMLELANRVEADPWFNMPHRARDDYIKNFAEIVRDNLNPSLPVYVEYSNEVWNADFSQGNWVEQQGITEWSNDRSNNEIKRINWYGKRTAQMCDIWKGVFGEQSHRVICVLSSQAANSRTATEALDCPLWRESPCLQHGIDVLAIAPYFGSYIGSHKNQSQVQNWTVDRLFQEIQQGGELNDSPPGGALQQAVEWMKENFEVANKRDLPLVAYEGGQHLVAHGGGENNRAITNLFMAANRDSRMYDVYLHYLDRWKTFGGTLFMHWLDIGKYSRWGSWGAWEHVEQESSPKYRALMTFKKQNSRSIGNYSR